MISFSETGILSNSIVITIPLVLAIGVVSTLKNPCAIPLYPAVTAACVNNASRDDLSGQRRRTSFISATLFVFGMALSIAILGVGASVAGRVIGIGRWSRYLIALLPLTMGMQRLGWLRLPYRGFTLTRTFRPGLGGAFATGLLFSLIVGSCGSEVIVSLLAYVAYHRAFVYGGILLFVYGVGAGIPLITFGTVVGNVTSWMEDRGYRKWIDISLGSTMLVLGFYLLWIA
jgi:cytochrome c-type biogenesis protein